MASLKTGRGRLGNFSEITLDKRENSWYLSIEEYQQHGSCSVYGEDSTYYPYDVRVMVQEKTVAYEDLERFVRECQKMLSM